MITKAIASAVVVMLVIGGIGTAMFLKDDDDPSTISIVDGSNNRIVLDRPLTKVAVINKNVPTTMKMLGIDDAVVCYYYGSNKLGLHVEELAKTETDRNLGTYYSPSVETLLKYGTEAVICPVSSMTIDSSAQKSCEEIGIKIIRLDCNGDSLLSDMFNLSKVFGDPESATSKIDTYMDERTAMIGAIVTSLKDVYLFNHLTIFGSRNAIYNDSSEISNLLGNIFCGNVTSSINLDKSHVTNLVTGNIQEEIARIENDIDVIIIRTDHSGTDGITSVKAKSYDKFVGDGDFALVDTNSSVYKNSRIYSVESDILSGLYGHIGLLVLVKVIYGIEVEGYEDINGVISDFQEEFGPRDIGVKSSGKSPKDNTDLVYRFGPEGTNEPVFSYVGTS